MQETLLCIARELIEQRSVLLGHVFQLALCKYPSCRHTYLFRLFLRLILAEDLVVHVVLHVFLRRLTRRSHSSLGMIALFDALLRKLLASLSRGPAR